MKLKNSVGMRKKNENIKDKRNNKEQSTNMTLTLVLRTVLILKRIRRAGHVTRMRQDTVIQFMVGKM